MKKTMMFLAAGLLIALPSAYGTVLNPGDVNQAPDAFSSSGYTILNSVSGTGTGATFSFTYTSWVVADTSNTFCSGCLDFVYLFGNDATSTDNVEHISTSSFAGWKTDVGYIAGTSPAPSTVSRTSGTGATVSFDYPGAANLLPGDNSAYLVVETNTYWYKTGVISAIDSQPATGSVPVFAPSVPEPVSMGLLGGGLAFLGLLGIRRRKMAKL